MKTIKALAFSVLGIALAITVYATASANQHTMQPANYAQELQPTKQVYSIQPTQTVWSYQPQKDDGETCLVQCAK